MSTGATPVTVADVQQSGMMAKQCHKPHTETTNFCIHCVALAVGPHGKLVNQDILHMYFHHHHHHHNGLV